MLGVATLIIVMSVMNGFRAELLGRILGLNGHLEVSAPRGNLGNYDEIADGIINVKIRNMTLRSTCSAVKKLEFA